MTTDGLNSFNLNYNYLNLTSEVSDQSGTVRAKYTYLADGTKLGVRDGSGQNGFDYLGSLVYKVENGKRKLESVAFGGGRIVVSETRTYFTDFFGSGYF